MLTSAQEEEMMNYLDRELEVDGDRDGTAMKERRLFTAEVYWREHYSWLKDQGYVLRPRYHPEWVASWKDERNGWIYSEDGQVIGMSPSILMDATRTSDGALVMLKKVDSTRNPNEVNIGRFFSGIAGQADNYCIPIYDVLHVPDDSNIALLVMPFLRNWRWPELQTIGEAAEFFRQLFRGLAFMHSHSVAHNDVKVNNIMMDPSNLFEIPCHPVNDIMTRDYSRFAQTPHSRTLRPVRYYLIDFGHSRRYNSKSAREPIGANGYGGDLTVPEFKTQKDCDPFAVDVYRAANFIRENFIVGNIFGDGKKRGFGFMAPLLQDMCQEDPTKRPTINEVVSRYEEIIKSLSQWKLRSRLVDQHEPGFVSLLLAPGHWARQIGRVFRRIPALPSPIA